MTITTLFEQVLPPYPKRFPEQVLPPGNQIYASPNNLYFGQSLSGRTTFQSTPCSSEASLSFTKPLLYFHIAQGVPSTASASSFWVFDMWRQPSVDKAANGSLPSRLLSQHIQHSTSKRGFGFPL